MKECWSVPFLTGTELLLVKEKVKGNFSVYLPLYFLLILIMWTTFLGKKYINWTKITIPSLIKSLYNIKGRSSTHRTSKIQVCIRCISPNQGVLNLWPQWSLECQLSVTAVISWGTMWSILHLFLWWSWSKSLWPLSKSNLPNGVGFFLPETSKKT